MKIGIDVSQIAYVGSGVARYVRNLIEALAEHDRSNTYVLFFSSLRNSFPADLEQKLPENFELRRFYFPPTALEFLWNRAHAISVEQFIGDVDIFYSSDWIQPPVAKAKKITTVHDLIAYKYPETQATQIVETQKRRLALVKKECDVIMCDSESTKKDVQELLKIPANKLTVVYPSVSLQSEKIDEKKVLETYVQKKSYILSVGKQEPRKNIPKLIESFNNAKLTDTELLIVGPKGWQQETTSNNESVRFLGFVSDTELSILYKNAEFFIFPSLYEGFGYPVVEAMSLGTPVAVSGNSSLSEIVQDAGVTFDPTDSTDITKALVKLHSDKALRSKLSIMGKKQAARFSSKAFAEQVLKVFSSLT